MESTTRSRAKLFDAVVEETRQHPAFREIAGSDSRVGARALMQQTFDQWDSPDRQFVRDFQTEGFDARVFELYSCTSRPRSTASAGMSTRNPVVRIFGAGAMASSSTLKPQRLTLLGTLRRRHHLRSSSRS